MFTFEKKIYGHGIFACLSVDPIQTMNIDAGVMNGYSLNCNLR